MKKRQLRNDLILVGIITVVALSAFLLFRLVGKEGAFVTLSIDGNEQYRFALSENVEQVITVGDQINVLVIRDGKAYVSRANCPDGICAAHRPVSVVGETIVCLPHKLVIAVEE